MKTALTGIPAMPTGMIAELYTITLNDNSVLYYTTADIDLVYDGYTYLAGVFNVERGAITTKAGVEVDDVMITAYPHESQASEYLINGLTLPVFVHNGGFDNAQVKIYRARKEYVVHLFEGIVTDAQADKSKVDLIVSALTVLLNVQMPRNLYSAGCINSLYDSACSVVKASYANNSTVASGSTKSVINCGLADADAYYQNGTIHFTSGQNNGVIRTVKSYETGVITLAYPLKHTPAVSDTFTVYPGCNKTRADCLNKFSNAANFRGFPYIPVPEASV